MIEAYGLVKYGNYTFPSTYNTKLTSDVVYADGIASRKYTTNTLTVEFIINFDDIAGGIANPNGSETIDTYMMNLRNVLLKTRQDLHFTYQGAGLVSVIGIDQSNSMALCNEGEIVRMHAYENTPKPISLSWEPIAANRAARVTWVCEFVTEDCPFSCDPISGSSSRTKEFNYSRTFSINEEGVSRITTEITFLIVDVYLDEFTQRTADFYEFIPDGSFQEVPYGFKRIKQDYSFDKTLRRMTVILVDDEIPSSNPLFPYTIQIDASHTLTSSLNPEGRLKGSGFHSWDNSFEASIKIAPGYPVAVAEYIFRFLLWQRFGIVGVTRRIDRDDDTNKSTIKLENGDYKEDIKPKNILLSYEIKENIYSREATFKATYYSTYKLSKLLAHSGIFFPIFTRKDDAGKFPWDDGYLIDRAKEYENYQSSVSHITDKRGYRNPTNGQLNVIWDTCGFSDSRTDILKNNYIPYSVTPIVDFPTETDEGSSDDFDLLSKNQDDGYLKYHNEFEIIEVAHTAAIGIQQYDTAIDDYKRTKDDEILLPGDDRFNQFSIHNKNNAESSTAYKPSSLTGISGDSSFVLVMKGYGIRHRLPVAIPSVTTFNNQPAYRIGNPAVAQKQVTEGEEPLYAAKWRIEYSIDSSIEGDIFSKIRGNVFQGNTKVT